MDINEKKAYLVKLLIWIWLLKEKINFIAKDIDNKKEDEIDEIIIKLESYYTKQNILDKNFLKNIEKINNQIDESIESTIEKFEVDNFNF